MKAENKKPRKSQSLEDIIPELLGIPIHLKLFVPRGFADTLRKFVKNHGLDPKFDVRKILEYGLAQESDEELERLERERCQPSSEVHTNYAITKFKAYENLMDNKALTLKLQFLVSENERLKRLLLEKGLIDSIETEWTKEKINEFQEKYLFLDRKPKSSTRQF
jgi:hypothetical protein